jgi:hypothetical protein
MTDANDSKAGKTVDHYFERMVPAMGKAETINGEIIRAVTRIGYRWCNDGDKFFEGYGCETVGPALAFLTQCSEIDTQIRDGFAAAEKKAISGYSTDDDYEEFLQQLFELAVRHVETIPNKPTEVDMFDFDSDYQEEWDDDETFDWDDEDEDGWDQDPY